VVHATNLLIASGNGSVQQIRDCFLPAPADKAGLKTGDIIDGVDDGSWRKVKMARL
jgi:C-terminal processing protease CtpA/Prc